MQETPNIWYQQFCWVLRYISSCFRNVQGMSLETRLKPETETRSRHIVCFFTCLATMSKHSVTRSSHISTLILKGLLLTFRFYCVWLDAAEQRCSGSVLGPKLLRPDPPCSLVPGLTGREMTQESVHAVTHDVTAHMCYAFHKHSCTRWRHINTSWGTRMFMSSVPSSSILSASNSQLLSPSL